jgi:hypothetical protein
MLAGQAAGKGPCGLRLIVCVCTLQAAYAAYNAIASQAATVVGTMDKVWSGAGGPDPHNGAGQNDSQSGAASAQQQQARLALVLQSSEDGEEVYVQVWSGWLCQQGCFTPAILCSCEAACDACPGRCLGPKTVFSRLALETQS